MKWPDPTNLAPATRKRIGLHLFWWFIIGTPPAAVVTFIDQKVGLVVMQVVTFLGMVLVGWDILMTTDVREEQD